MSVQEPDILFSPWEGLTLLRKGGVWTFETTQNLSRQEVIRRLIQNGNRVLGHGQLQLDAAEGLRIAVDMAVEEK